MLSILLVLVVFDNALVDIVQYILINRIRLMTTLQYLRNFMHFVLCPLPLDPWIWRWVVRPSPIAALLCHPLP